MVKSESDPITDDEYLLRRVPKERFRTEKTPYISPTAFEPRTEKSRDPDTDGISLYREACLIHAKDCLTDLDPGKRINTGVVRVPMSKFKELGLTVEISRLDSIPGHVVVPQLSGPEFQKNRGKVKALMHDLAKSASDDENIVIDPHLS